MDRSEEIAEFVEDSGRHRERGANRESGLSAGLDLLRP